MVIEVSIDDFLYNYFFINKDVDSISVYDLNMIKFMVDKHQQSIFLDFCKDELTCVHLDFEYSIGDNSMKKIKSRLTYPDETIVEYMKIPILVTDCIVLYTRHKKIKQLRNKIYKEKTS